MQRNDFGSSVSWFLSGAVLGAGIAFLIAPESGRRTRRKLVKTAERGRRSFLESSQDIIDRGRELYERGREMAEDAAELFERGRRIAEKQVEERL